MTPDRRSEKGIRARAGDTKGNGTSAGLRLLSFRVPLPAADYSVPAEISFAVALNISMKFRAAGER